MEDLCRGNRSENDLRERRDKAEEDKKSGIILNT